MKHDIWTCPIKRILCWWSAGVTSAVATLLTIKEFKDKYPIEIIYCDTGSEHSDNERFRKECEDLYKVEIKVMKNPKYNDTWDVFEKSRYLVGIYGAECTRSLKKFVRKKVEDLPTDLQVYGFDSSEKRRVDRFKENNPEVRLYVPLFDKEISKKQCANILASHKIELPEMYKLGYKNNNCIGCPKGGMGYWNKIRKDFPETFDRMAKVERKLDVAICKSYAGDGKRKRVFLDELEEGKGKYESELKSMQCGIVCGE